MAKCLVSLSTVPSVNINSTAYDFESIEQAVLFAKNCSSPDSVNVVLDLLDDAGEFVQRLYDYDCKTELDNVYPIIESEPAIESADVESGSTSESLEPSEPSEFVADAVDTAETISDEIAVVVEEAKEEVLEQPSV